MKKNNNKPEAISDTFHGRGQFFADKVGDHIDNGFIWIWGAMTTLPAFLSQSISEGSIGQFGLSVSVATVAVSSTMAVADMIEREVPNMDWKRKAAAGLLTFAIGSGVGVATSDVAVDVYKAVISEYFPD